MKLLTGGRGNDGRRSAAVYAGFFALLRGASMECLVCGEFVMKKGPHLHCPECGSTLREQAVRQERQRDTG